MSLNPVPKRLLWHGRGVKSAGKMYVKSFLRKGQALMGLGRHQEASLAFEEGLRMDPFNWDIKLGLEEAGKLVLKDLLTGVLCPLSVGHDKTV